MDSPEYRSNPVASKRARQRLVFILVVVAVCALVIGTDVWGTVWSKFAAFWL